MSEKHEGQFREVLKAIFEECRRLTNEEQKKENLQPSNVIDISQHLALKRFGRLSPEDAATIYSACEELEKSFQAKSFDTVIEIAEILLQYEDLMPPQLGIYFRYAWALAKTKKNDEARMVCEKGIDKFPKQNAVFHAIIGDTYFDDEKGLYLAQMYYKKALKLAKEQNDHMTSTKVTFDLALLETKIAAKRAAK